MGATIEALHNLQEIEIQIAELQRRIDRKRDACKRQEKQIAGIDRQIETIRRELHVQQKDSDRLNLDLRAHEEQVAKLRDALNTAKNQKEYSAVLTQLNTFKADNSKSEERILELMSAIDEFKKNIAALEAQRAKEHEKLAELEAAAQAAEDKASDRLTKLRAERQEAATGIAPETLDMFNRVAAKNDGEAMAVIMRTHPRRQEYACEGCNMSITIEQVNNVLSRDEAVLCNVCGRILYAEASATAATK
ncbi:MAG: hypothetical protein H6819_12700 [Phycisphaerales bacterium]|nr:hypothetical protein [Phycisphaerales bacterium]MCB9856666.1 hypothetical protein [Phycisphaerales bacterium]MCB9862207.1 hypothetical protein [Phycisphaerales bacterium]